MQQHGENVAKLSKLSSNQDDQMYSIILIARETLGTTVPSMLEQYGRYFLRHVSEPMEMANKKLKESEARLEAETHMAREEQRRLQEANAELAEERNRMHALLQRQYELIEVMQSTASQPSHLSDSPQTQSLFKEKIQVLRDILSEARGSDMEAEEIRLGKILGQGNVSASISVLLNASDTILPSSVWGSLSGRVARHDCGCEANGSPCCHD